MNTRRDPLMDFKSSIVLYLLLLEQEYHRGCTSYREDSRREAWYLRRVWWLHQLCSIMEIPVSELIQGMRSVDLSTIESPHGSMDVSKCVEHFRSSMADGQRGSFPEEVMEPDSTCS